MKKKEDVIVTVIRIPIWLHKQLTADAERDERSVNSQMVYLLKTAVEKGSK